MPRMTAIATTRLRKRTAAVRWCCKRFAFQSADRTWCGPDPPTPAATDSEGLEDLAFGIKLSRVRYELASFTRFTHG